MKAILYTIGLLVALALVGTQSGCEAVSGSAATVGRLMDGKGDLTSFVDADVQRTTAATKLAMQDMRFALVDANCDAEEGRVEARVGSDNKAVIHLTRKGEKVTRVNIRIGTFGNESISREILAKLESHLNDPGLRASARVP